MILDRLDAALAESGPAGVIDRLVSDLTDAHDHQGLFYALLMKKRCELGLAPIATGNNNDVPAEKLDAFENGIREAARTVGQMLLSEGKIPQAWLFYRMIGEPGPVREALQTLELSPDEDPHPFIAIALHEGVAPNRGFDWLLERYGTCNAITTVSSGEMPPDFRSYCAKKLIRTLHDDLFARLKEEVEAKQGFPPSAKTIGELIEGRDWLFAEDAYHVDLSHLNAVIQMSGQIEPGEEMKLARDLCKYGQKLSNRFGYQTDPPFENLYVDYDVYLSILLGENVDQNLAHFHKKAEEADPETIGPYPAEVLVNLLLRIGRPAEALEVSKKYLTDNVEGRRTCPSFVELCQQTKSYDVLAEVSRGQGNPINYAAALLARAK